MDVFKVTIAAFWWDGIFDWIYNAVRKVICWFLDWFCDLGTDALLAIAAFLPDVVVDTMPISWMNDGLRCAERVFPVAELGIMFTAYLVWKLPFMVLRWMLRILPWST